MKATWRYPFVPSRIDTDTGVPKTTSSYVPNLRHWVCRGAGPIVGMRIAARNEADLKDRFISS